ncbi:hypothetical protein D0Z07_6074 [Hyphodiscus hymeniophilus]|uniref:N-acetyltransferase domain-containing protein n=1 Tax=Hyphodiscus hymeniophilus TaxID=353542 RepID=A0A9P6VHM6_9HELO|nr:hypothetical protein D0Z07_6074 [Hyphodiscus hymeniophilus]
MSSSKPTNARPFHSITTPRLILRSGVPQDARAVATIRSEPLNNPHGGVHEPDLPIETQAQRLLEQQESTAAGKNAWMQILLKPIFTDHIVEELLVEDGVMIGMTGFNSFPTATLKTGTKEMDVIVGDTGAMIDYRYARKRYALEAIEAIFEYGFAELGCGMMNIDTAVENKPWRTLMKTLGLEDVEKLVKTDTGEEVVYKFDKEKWDGCKKGLKERGKWML